MRLTPASDHNPLSALWRPPALMAVLLGGEALAAILALAPMQVQSQSRLVLFGLASLGIQWTTIATLCALFLLRTPLGKLPRLRLAWACLALFLLMSLMVSAAAWSILLMTGNADLGREAFILRLMGMALIVGMIALVTYQNYWQSRQLAVRAKQLELEALQARIHPHFLFNTLNTGAALIHAQPDAAERVLLDLADLFRHALRGPQWIALSEEMELTRRYLAIEMLRFGPRLDLTWQLPETLPVMTVPSLSIQPLAENAIRHGIEALPKGGKMEIRVETQPNWVIITVANDLPEHSTPHEGHAIGLASARERILAMTQEHGRVETAIEHGRFITRVYLPVLDADTPIESAAETA
jgi:two-component system, LytTR family, sensor histidine kinase AlgZ